MIRRRAVAHGLVQGVFFRDSCRREANARGVSGWVRNRPDGSVEAAFEGAPDAVEALCAWFKVGPELAVVDHVDVLDEEPQNSSGFQVR